MGARLIFISIVIFLLTASAFAAEEREIIVGRCKMNVISMTTPQEHAQGLLGYTELTFHRDGMLFEMNRKGRKSFHTMGMKMNIRIMGVMQVSDGVYRVIGTVKKGQPGQESITIDAPDVLEIPEQRYLLRFRSCLEAPEAN